MSAMNASLAWTCAGHLATLVDAHVHDLTAIEIVFVSDHAVHRGAVGVVEFGFSPAPRLADQALNVELAELDRAPARQRHGRRS